MSIIYGQLESIYEESNNTLHLTLVEKYGKDALEYNYRYKAKEEEVYKEMIEDPDYWEKFLEEERWMKENGWTIKKLCEAGMTTDPVYCENPEAMDAVTYEEMYDGVVNAKARFKEVEDIRSTLELNHDKATQANDETKSLLLYRNILFFIHSIFLVVESIVILDTKGKKMCSLILSLTFIFYQQWLVIPMYKAFQTKEVQSLDHEEKLEFIMREFPVPNGVELYNYHLFLFLYMIFDGIYYFFLWGTGNTENRNYEGNRKSYKDKKSKKDVAELSKFYQYCATGNKDKVKEVIRKHHDAIDINAIKDGNTALHLAVNGDHHATVQVIVTNYEDRINTSLVNKQGYCVLDLAVLKKNLSIFNLLMKHSEPKINSLVLAVEMLQDQMIRALKSKLAETLQEEIKVEIDVICDLIKEARKKNFKSVGKESMKRNIEMRQQIIVKYLTKKDTNLPSSDSLQEVLNREYECPVCFETISYPLQIYACTGDHLLCSECLQKHSIKQCPCCREDFNKFKPQRRPAYERFVERLPGIKSNDLTLEVDSTRTKKEKSISHSLEKV